MCWHRSSCTASHRHCLSPLRLETSGSSSTNHETERAASGYSTCRSLAQPHNLRQNAHHCKIPYKGTCSYHHFTSTLSYGAVEYLPRGLWATVSEAKFSFFVQAGTPWGLAQLLDQCRKIWKITSLRRISSSLNAGSINGT